MNTLEKILEEIKALKAKQNSDNRDYKIGYLVALSTVEGVIAGMNDGWIPTSEKLPEGEEGSVLVTVNGKYGRQIFVNAIMLAEYDDKFNEWDVYGLEGWKNPNVTAWMPLPKGYEGGK